ncbi:cold-regulated 413 inner membrane protein 1, chloroplastic [Selaginella moellendorffii]|nr:cold-regulated 413 inner membrane protein 1, chloroplastic [Selaginella moellendorffii]|eukprot:XP_002973315.2 cold-regulated 413 inner membrane protein 1, chloroplastic [Selaginella moellendorffii]
MAMAMPLALASMAIPSGSPRMDLVCHHQQLGLPAPRGRSLFSSSSTIGKKIPLAFSSRMMKRGCKTGAFSAQCSGETLRWVSTVSAVALLLVKNTGVRKSLLVPLLALQMPQNVINWMKGEYGLWSAFLALTVRLFYTIPGELELPLVLLLLVITAPYQVMQQRGTQAGLIIWATLSSYLGFQHISRAGGIGRAFHQRVLVPTVASIFLVAVPVVLLYQGL